MDASFWHHRRVFVTGHTGFKGSWLCLQLAQAGADVAGFSDGVPTTPSLYAAARVEELVTSVAGDVRDRDSVERALARHEPEVVFHLAAQSLVRRSFAEPVLTYETNVLGTVNMLEAVRTVPSVRVAIIVTTDKVYEHRGSRAHTEDDVLGGSDPYSSSKACAELATAAYRETFFSDPEAAAVATVRAGNVIGGGDWAADRLIPDIVGALAEGRPVEIRYPQAIRPWQHVLNPLDGYLLLAERLWDDRDFARAWNFGPVRSDARPVAWVAQRLADLWGTKLEITSPDRPQLPEAPSLELDATRATEALGWRPRWGLERALAATVEWYRSFAEGADVRELSLAQIETFAAAAEPPPVRS